MPKMTSRSIRQCLSSRNYRIVGSWVDIRMLPKTAVIYYALPREDVARATQLSRTSGMPVSRESLISSNSISSDQVAQFATGLWSPPSQQHRLSRNFYDGYVEKYTVLLRFGGVTSRLAPGLFTLQIKNGIADHRFRQAPSRHESCTVLVRRADKRTVKVMSHSVGEHPYVVDLPYHGWSGLSNQVHRDQYAPINNLLPTFPATPRIRLINPIHYGRSDQILSYRQFRRYFPATKFSFTCL